MSKVVRIADAPALSEDALHKSVANYLTLALPKDAIFHHSPNQGTGRRNVAYRVKLKQMGCRFGWPDIEIIYQGRGYFIELKAPGYRMQGKRVGKGYPTKDQKDCHADLRKAGAMVAVCWSLDEVKDCLWGWGIIGPGNNSEVRDSLT